MLGPSTLLTYNTDDSGNLTAWLEKLGLKSFLEDYPVHKLIEWGWLRPQYRVVFPKRFFDEWADYPFMSSHPPADLNGYATLWSYTWTPDEPSEPYWFLDPAFRPNVEFAEILKTHRQPEVGATVPLTIKHKSGREISPYLDYFYRWQAFALIDVIRASDCFRMLYRTPDMVDRANQIVKTAEYLNEHSSPGPTAILTAPNRWGGLVEPMSWLAHLRSFHDALFRHGDESNMAALNERYKQGAQALADYFGVSDVILADVIQDKLLVLANSWMPTRHNNRASGPWEEKGWVYLQGEVQLAVTWLIILSGKSFSHYVDKWKSPAFGNFGWAALEEVLPYGFLEHGKKFSKVAPYYLKEFNAIKGNQWALGEAEILKVCRDIRKRNYPFGGFLAAFYELHEHLAHRSVEEHGVDFRELRPLDHFAMLAIHAEGCLRRELDTFGALSAIKGSSQTLSKYIEEVARLRGMPSRLIGKFSQFKRLADLKQDRSDPIGKIYALETELPQKEHVLLQAFLCCVLARNYFAHHDFLDRELLRTPLAAFLLRGILLSVITLLNVGLIKSRS